MNQHASTLRRIAHSTSWSGNQSTAMDLIQAADCIDNLDSKVRDLARLLREVNTMHDDYVAGDQMIFVITPEMKARIKEALNLKASGGQSQQPQQLQTTQ